MAKSSFIHGLSIVTAILGALALIAAWFAGEGGTTLGFSQSHLFNDAIALTLFSVSGGVCAIYRRSLEREGR